MNDEMTKMAVKRRTAGLMLEEREMKLLENYTSKQSIYIMRIK